LRERLASNTAEFTKNGPYDGRSYDRTQCDAGVTGLMDEDRVIIEIADEELPQWENDDVVCQLCGDGGSASSLVLCSNTDAG
jgi:hypothetical protein